MSNFHYQVIEDINILNFALTSMKLESYRVQVDALPDQVHLSIYSRSNVIKLDHTCDPLSCTYDHKLNSDSTSTLRPILYKSI